MKGKTDLSFPRSQKVGESSTLQTGLGRGCEERMGKGNVAHHIPAIREAQVHWALSPSSLIPRLWYIFWAHEVLGRPELENQLHYIPKGHGILEEGSLQWSASYCQQKVYFFVSLQSNEVSSHSSGNSSALSPNLQWGILLALGERSCSIWASGSSPAWDCSATCFH